MKPSTRALSAFGTTGLVLGAVLTSVPSSAQAATQVIRIDAGSTAAFTDSAGRTWQADRYATGGSVTANATRNGPTLTADPQLLKTMRYGKDFSYSIPVASAGTYVVRLHTSELNFATAGSRRFTVSAEGKPVSADLDLAKAPGKQRPWTLEVPVSVTDGKLDLRFVAALDYAQISAIEVIGAGAAPAPSSSATGAIRIDAASSTATTDAAGRVWQSDRFYAGGASTANASRQGPGLTSDPQLLKTMRYGKDFSYAIPLASSGTYLVRLLTPELNFSVAGQRRFTISAEGQPVSADLDLAKAPGIRRPWTLEVPVSVTDGTLDLRFVAGLDYAQVSAIEVVPVAVTTDPYVLKWSDEFSGTAVDTTKWRVRNDWAAENEESIGTSRPENVFVQGGALTIRSLRETRTISTSTGPKTRAFTSGYLDTDKTQSWTYGRFAMRAKLATQAGTSKGIWPAFWMRPATGGNGEIDIMEGIGSGAGGVEWNRTHQTIHHDYLSKSDPAHKEKEGQYFTFPSGTPSDGFHEYSVQWEPGVITWSIDGREVFRRDRTTTPWFDEVFSKPYTLRLNQQVGGTWAGTPDSATIFPADFVVDWIRVYQKP